MISPLEYWKNTDGKTHITPRAKFNPEGDWFIYHLAWIAQRNSAVLEFGCGPGRLAGYFQPEQYIGLDVNKQALKIAQQVAPKHTFQEVPETGPLPERETYLCHTVLLHIPDTELHATLERFRCNRVYVSEVLGREWRRPGNPPVFNRDFSDYCWIFSKSGFENTSFVQRPYEHYGDNVKTACMVFERVPHA